ncbi:MAG TPA: hypothetical protein VMF13_09325 [Luteitalea sp.]|nr:hypothetical protein [Luteitalea sp.]
MDQARALARQAPPPGDPTRRLYANLDFYVATLRVPDGASEPEIAEYRRLFELTSCSAST